jgi:hypothetical protein
VQSAERGLTIGVVSLTFLAVVGFLWFRRRRMKLLDQNPERLFGNRELIFGPASGAVPESEEEEGDQASISASAPGQAAAPSGNAAADVPPPQQPHASVSSSSNAAE